MNLTKFILGLAVLSGCTADTFTSGDADPDGSADGSGPDVIAVDASGDEVPPDVQALDGPVALDSGTTDSSIEAEAGCPSPPFPYLLGGCPSSEATCLRSNTVTCEISGAACYGNGYDGGAWLRCGKASDCANLGGHCCLTQNDVGVAGCPNVITVQPGVGVATVCDTGCGLNQSQLLRSEVCVSDSDCPGSAHCKYSVFSYAGGEFQHFGICQ